MLTFRLSCCRICSKHPQHWHHASLLVSNMLYRSSGSWRCYQLFLLGQLPRGRFGPESPYSPRSPFPPTEELCCAGNPTHRASHLRSSVAKHTVTLPARWARRAASEGPRGSGSRHRSPRLCRITKLMSSKPVLILSERIWAPPLGAYINENNSAGSKGWLSEVCFVCRTLGGRTQWHEYEQPIWASQNCLPP